MTHEEKLRTQAAKNILGQSDWQLLVKALEKDMFDQWTATNVGDVDKREEYHKVMTGIRFAVSKINYYASQGNFEETREESIPEA